MKIIRKFYPLVILLIVGLIPILDLLHPGLPITHDGQDHVARIVNFYQSLTERNIIPRWAANLNWGYGHPILMFLYPLPSYIVSLFHFLGFSFVDSLKIVFGLTFVLSGFTMYLWIKSFLSKEAALISGALYVLASYRFVDLYVRGAIGEHVAFLFIPLILYFILKLSIKYSKFAIFGGAFSIAGLILSHNAISLMFLPLSLLYALYLYSKQKDYIKSLVLIFVIGFGISAFFWMPALLEGRYTLRDIVTAGDYRTRFVNFPALLYGSWSYGGTGQFSVQIGIIQWIFAILSIPVTVYLYKVGNKLWILSLGCILVFLLSIFLMLPYSNLIWERLKILQNFQFPWRFLSISVFITSVIGGIVVSQIKNHRLFIACAVLIALILINKNYWRANNYKVVSESFFTGIYNGTTDTGESSPVWSVRFMEQRPKSHIEVIGGDANITQVKRNSTMHEYSVVVLKSAQFKENTLYFPGWKVWSDGKEIPIEFQDPHNRGVMTFNLFAGTHTLDIQFGETNLRYLANLISIASLVALFVLLKFKKT